MSGPKIFSGVLKLDIIAYTNIYEASILLAGWHNDQHVILNTASTIVFFLNNGN